MSRALCEGCGSKLPIDGSCTSCGLVHGDPCDVCGFEGLHKPGCTAQRLYGNAVGPRRPIAYGVRWCVEDDRNTFGVGSGFCGRVDRRWDRDMARRAAVDLARDRRKLLHRAVEVFALFANGDTEGLGACEFDVGAGFVRWFKKLEAVKL